MCLEHTTVIRPSDAMASPRANVPHGLPARRSPIFFELSWPYSPHSLSPFSSVLSNLNLFLDRDGTHPVTSVVIVSHYFTQSVLREGPRPASLPRHPDRNPVTVTPLLSHSCKCPLSQLLSFDTLANARGVGGPPAFSRRSNVPKERNVSPLTATLVDPPASVANKRLTVKLSLLDATLTENRGRGALLILQTFKRSTFQRPCPIRPIAPRNPWCNNERRRKNTSPSGETTPLSPVSKHSERIHPDLVGVASQAWVHRSNAERVSKVRPQQGGPNNSSVQDDELKRVGKAGSVRLG